MLSQNNGIYDFKHVGLVSSIRMGMTIKSNTVILSHCLRMTSIMLRICLAICEAFCQLFCLLRIMSRNDVPGARVDDRGERNLDDTVLNGRCGMRSKEGA